MKICLKCGQYVCKVFGCRRMVFCGDNGSVGLFYIVYLSFVCNCFELTVASGGRGDCFWVNTQRWKNVFGIVSGPEKGLGSHMSSWCPHGDAVQ